MPGNTADRIAHHLTVEILRGRPPAGTRLPTVRALAARFSVTPATIQRALARLAFQGLVRPRQGSGTLVCDPETAGDLSLLPAWLEATADDPASASTLLGDFLEVRRVLAVRLLVRHRTALIAALPELAELAGDLLTAAPRDVQALRAADIAFARALLRRTGNRAVLAILNTADALLRTVPGVAEAMYATPEANAAGMLGVLAALQTDAPDEELARQLDETLTTLDESTVIRFERHLRERT